MAEPERADEFRDAIAKLPARSFSPSKKQAASGLTVLLLIVVAFIRFANIEARSHPKVNNTAYLECVAQQESAALDATGPGLPGADPSFGFPSSAGAPISTGEALAQADTACASYPH